MIFMLVVSFSICNVYADGWGDLNVVEQIKNGIAAGVGGAVADVELQVRLWKVE